MTGGWSRADIVISGEPIDYPMVTKLDALVAMYQDGLDSNLKLLKKDAVVIVEGRLVDVSKAGGRNALPIAAANAAEGLGRKILTNIVLLGSLSAVLPVVSTESLEAAVSKRFPKAAQLNVKALETGQALAKQAVQARGIVA